MLTFALAVAAKCALVMALVCALGRILRRTSASRRHALYMVALLTSVALPLAAALLPSWRVLPVVDVRVVHPAQLSASRAAFTPLPTNADVNWPLIALASTWMGGALLALVRIARGMRQARNLRTVSTRILSREWESAINSASTLLPQFRTVRFVECELIGAPCTSGLWRPVVMLPSESTHWTHAARRNAIVHEIAHVRRFDIVAQTLANIACALHWYNPLSWLIANDAALAREQACDDLVLTRSAVASDYAALLMTFTPATTRVEHADQVGTALSFARKSHVAARVRAILNPAIHRSQGTLMANVTALATALVVAVSLGSAQTVEAQKPATAPGKLQPETLLPFGRLRVLDAAVTHMCSTLANRTRIDSTSRTVTFTISVSDVTSLAAKPPLKQFTVKARCP